ncbi:hypothetical protein PR003_g23144 [Phytophthora rubi]|uniref:Uncharacterized protein n=1 Tax=Phytophthora rubi TaxID=129364 RepID=A0A6A4D6X2_9STRA|nr:hypothetical protein PR003_g23144 [Phytophthora rubi]
MQSFLGSLNYYGRFIEDMAIYASVLYELREVDFAAIRDRDRRGGAGPTVTSTEDPQYDQATVDPKWVEAEAAFSELKKKIAATPILRHFDTEKRPVVIVYASEWAVSASLVQDHDGINLPVMFTSRTLKQNELNYGIVEKEVLALLRMLDLGYSMLVGRSIQVLARHSTLAWLFRAAGLHGRLGQWAALLSPWTLEITKCTREEDEILGSLAAAVTPRSVVGQALTAIAPRKEPRRSVDTPVPTVEQDKALLVASFDGSARVKRDRTRLVICGDSNLVIRQMKGDIDCKAPALTLLRQKALRQLGTWPVHDLLHVKRAWNASAYSLASVALQREAGVIIQGQDWDDLVMLNRLPEILTATAEETTLRISAMATRPRRKVPNQEVLQQEDAVRQLRVDRIRQGQDEEKWIANLKHYLRGQVADLRREEARACSNLADDFEMDEQDLLYYCPPSRKPDKERDGLLRLVIPETLHQDLLHHYHVSLEGGHQGISRTYQRIKDRFYWRGLFRSVQRFIGECTDCETGKGRPTLRGESPGNVQAIYPFQILAMDHIPSLPKSYKGHTDLLIWVDQFTGYVVAKASASRTAQTIAESYEECVFRRFGASEMIRQDREPGFMSDFFKAINRILGQRQLAAMSNRPQANGTVERMVQTMTRALKMYVAGENQRDWDEYAERPRRSGDAPRQYQAAPRRWRYRIQKYYQQARAEVNERLKMAIADRAERHNEGVEPHTIAAGYRVWLYLDRVKEGYARKLAHMWHGPFRVKEMVSNFAARLETAGTDYRLFPVVHVSKLKPVRVFPGRPTVTLTAGNEDRLDFDEALLPEDSWDQELEEGEYDVERIRDVRTGRRTRYGRTLREFQVYWRGYDDPTWVDEADLNCGALLHEFLQDRAKHSRFQVVQSHEEA